MRMILCGADGRMGRVVAELAPARGDTIVCGLSANQNARCDFPVYSSFDQVREKADIILDFSAPALLMPLLAHARAHSMPVVIASTGHSAQDLQAIQDAAAVVPVLRAANMSLGIAVMRRLMRSAQAALQGFDIEIVEKHHRMKKDAPSGTALTLFEDLRQANPALRRVSARDGVTGERTDEEVGVFAVRGGTLVGEHTVSFYGEDEVVEIRHTAHSRRIFGVGALASCRALLGKPAGLYTLDDVLFGENEE